MLDWLRILGSIILVDLVLSGDNALIIGAVAATIPRRLRWLAFVVGGGGAIVLRILLTYFFTLLLHVPYLQAIGGFLLFFITVQLIMSARKAGQHDTNGDSQGGATSKSNGFLARHFNSIVAGMVTILIADVTTSLDNIVAIAALAKDNTFLLITGLLLSVLLLLVGSAIVSRLMERFSWLIVVAAAILAWTAARLILDDDTVADIVKPLGIWWEVILYSIAALSVLVPGYLWLRSLAWSPRALFSRKRPEVAQQAVEKPEQEEEQEKGQRVV